MPLMQSRKERIRRTLTFNCPFAEILDTVRPGISIAFPAAYASTLWRLASIVAEPSPIPIARRRPVAQTAGLRRVAPAIAHYGDDG